MEDDKTSDTGDRTFINPGGDNVIETGDDSKDPRWVGLLVAKAYCYKIFLFQTCMFFKVIQSLKLHLAPAPSSSTVKTIVLKNLKSKHNL